MNPSINKQHQQVNNIFLTLIEASEHFHKLIKEKELNQSIFIFGSIVEGFSAVANIDAIIDIPDWPDKKNKIEKYFLNIAQQLEKGNFLKISEILQFSYLPYVKKIAREISQKTDGQNEEKTYTIGVFSSFHNPRDFYPEPRIHAMVKESERQNAKLLFFTSKDVNFNKKEIEADVCIQGEWERVTAPFPDVINNAGSGRRSYVERKLRRFIPFTSFHVGNKFSLPQRMVKYKKYAELLVPFRLCRNESDIRTFLEQNNKVVFKYLLSNRGENIFFVTKKGSRYTLQEHKKEQILNQDAFNKWLQTIILKEKESFIVQKYIHTRTKDDEPYHFRAHVQKDGTGEWVLTHIYPRVGSKKSNLSNVATDGRVDDFHEFLQREYGEKGKTYEKDILRLSLEIAQHLDKLYGLALDELGIDLAIDENGRYWMHEANNGPQTAYHEEKRAVNTIAYAKYIAENGIFYTDNLRKMKSGMFQAKTANLPLAELDNRTIIGVLQGKIVSDPLALALAETANKENMHLFSFTPKDIDYDQMLIRGYFYEHEEWVPKIVEYPDVIFDRLKLRGDENAQWIYEELEDIPFTNEWPGRQHLRSEINEKLITIQGINDRFVPFQKVTRTRDIFRYLEEYGKAVLKPEIGDAMATQYIERLSSGRYRVTNGKSFKEYHELPLMNKLKDAIKETAFIVQKDPRCPDKNNRPFSICTHLMLGKEGEWNFVSHYAHIQASLGDHKSHHVALGEFLQENYGEKNAVVLENEIKDLSKRIASALGKMYGDIISEAAIMLAIDDNMQLGIIEVNPNGFDTIYDAAIHGERVIACANYLVASNPSKEIQLN